MAWGLVIGKGAGMDQKGSGGGIGKPAFIQRFFRLAGSYVIKNNDLEKTVQIILAIIENELKLKGQALQF